MTYKTIVATTILIQWNDSPKMEVCEYEMSGDCQQAYDEWLEEIEHERNQGAK